MTNDSFQPSPELAQGLARLASEGLPLYELVVPRRPIRDDLSGIPGDAAFVATRGTAKSLHRLADLHELIAIWASPATSELFEACARSPMLRAIYVTHFKRLDQVRLEGAQSLEHLMLDWAPSLVDLSFLKELPALRVLYLENMKRIDLSTLPELSSLRGLVLGGTMWSTLKLADLSPLTRLPQLRVLRLSNAKPIDGSLRPLAQLTELRELDLPNFFDFAEYARLAHALPKTTGSSLTPYFASGRGEQEASGLFRCAACGGRKVMMTGRPSAVLCLSCDDVKIRTRVRRWEEARTTRWS